MKSIGRTSSFHSLYHPLEEKSSLRNSFNPRLKSGEYSKRDSTRTEFLESGNKPDLKDRDFSHLLNSEEADYIVEVPDNKGQLFDGLVAELRFNREENKLFAKPLYANSKDVFTLPTLMVGALTIAIIESLIVNYATPHNPEMNHFLNKTLPSKITYTGETTNQYLLPTLMMIGNYFKKKHMPRHIEGEQIKAHVNYDM